VPHIETERVLVVPTALFHRLGHFQGFSAEVDRYLDELLDPRNTSFRARAEVEEDPGYKQLIPYVLFRHRSAEGEVRLFAYTRGNGQGEGRLRLKRSVGVGGHISAEDASEGVGDPYGEGMRREIEEEVEVGGTFHPRLVGLINDDQTPVGRVHLGVVHVCDLAAPAVRPREADIQESGFVPVGELMADMSRLESWSQICLEALFGRRALAVAAT
jgi:predicted NUDIX family phosphoesterase